METHDAENTSIQLIKFCTQFGFPENILSDQGVEFTSNTLKELNKLLNINHKLASPYHPQTNGSLERTHLTLKDYFKCYVNEDQNNWDEFLNLAIYAYNTNIHKSTHKTPYELVFGQQPKIPNIMSKPVQKPNYSELANDIARKLQIIRKSARENQINAKEKSKGYYDKTHHRTYEFKENDLVLLYDSLKKKTNKKLSKNYKGPYKIIQIHDNQTATLKLENNKLKTYHYNLLKPYNVSDNGQQNEENENNFDLTVNDPSIDDPGDINYYSPKPGPSKQ
ncbi:hypothetical protein WA026_015439 [Henosepilachna vigintioctopunctata]|uniref:Integrase catalytic domain-containing protein n=1 Tax=Henosepilachna vigintioctopunctata TaxID=420089 RepID=A0AAW1ULE0_9CUCU